MGMSRAVFWILLGSMGGVITYVLLSKFAHGLVAGDAGPLSILAGVLLFGLQYVRLKAPQTARARARANLTPRARFVLLLIFGLATIGAATAAVLQAMGGYPFLAPAALISAPAEPEAGFYSAKGRPMNDVLYTMDGQEGSKFLVPLAEYEGRLLIIVGRHPPESTVRVTGRLRSDFRGVQSAGKGQIDGPFRQLYREHMRLPPNTPVYFLDTAMRAGLNFRAVSFVAAPFYLFLLIWGAPTRKKLRVTRRRLG